ncbi:hypothetical protein EP331_03880 [bacterium]|nr:MAG: hypothetical protein EP331_03880 [bacterium]
MKHYYKLLLAFLLVASSAVNVQAQEEESCYPYGLGALEVFSIFSESYKTKDYDLAILYGEALMKCNPKKMEELQQYKGEDVFEKMIDIYVQLAKKEKDPTKKSSLLDSSITYFGRVFAINTPDEIDIFDWTLKRGRFYQENADFINDGYAKAYADYQTLIDMNPERITKLGSGYYVQITLQNLVTQGEKDKALAIINKTSEFADDGTKSFIEKVQDQLFSNPAERIVFLEGKLADAPKDISILNELYELYLKQNNLEKAVVTAKTMYEVNPNFKNVMTMATISKKNSNNKDAINFLNEALKLATEKKDKAQVYYELADTYLLIEDLKKARDNAKKAISEAPNWGQPYIKLAGVYAQAVSLCASSNMEREDKAVYWLVLDYLDKAKQVDAEVTSMVNNLYKSYQPVTPTAEEKFFKGWTKGNDIKIDKSLRECYEWINESTKIR